ncbi:MAG: EAL domain-containing protein [Myxococcales bacterium]|nr:EAL domain-containing protein [Myxococcales bacterium]
MPDKSLRRPRVLVADDDRLVLRSIESSLTRAGFEVTTAADGPSAEARLKDGPFDVIVSDIGMPGSDGVSLLRAVRKQDLDVPVILITGDPQVNTAIEAVELGAMKYLTKPFRIAELVELVGRAELMHRLARLERQSLRLLDQDRALLAADRAGLEANFSRALAEVWMAFQPIVDWSGRRVFGYEALLRCKDPVLCGPMPMLDAAERLGAMQALGRTVRRKVATAIAERSDEALFFVNLHPSDLEDPDLYDPHAPLTAHASRVILEITERAQLDVGDEVVAQVQRLRALGYRLAIDDLGAGYSGLRSYVQLSPEIVKLDGALIRGADEDPRRREVIAAMVDLSQRMGNQVILEGVETRSELQAVVQLGANLLQGYALARPGWPWPQVDFSGA